MTSSHVWIDGRVRTTAEARIDPYDRGLLLGDGLYETLRAERGRCFRTAAHVARLCRSADALGLAVERDPAVWDERFRAVLAANGLEGALARVRLTVTRGVGGHVADAAAGAPTVVVTADALPAALDDREALGIAGWPVRMMRHPDLAEHKTLCLVPSIVGHRLMRARGGAPADEPLFSTKDGFLLEGASSNLFVVLRDGALVTPPLHRPLLPGITRAALLELLPDAREADVRLDDLRDAREAFVTRSTRGLSPIVRLEDAPLGDGRPGPRAQEARAAYAALVAREVA